MWAIPKQARLTGALKFTPYKTYLCSMLQVDSARCLKKDLSPADSRRLNDLEGNLKLSIEVFRISAVIGASVDHDNQITVQAYGVSIRFI